MAAQDRLQEAQARLNEWAQRNEGLLALAGLAASLGTLVILAERLR